LLLLLLSVSYSMILADFNLWNHLEFFQKALFRS